MNHVQVMDVVDERCGANALVGGELKVMVVSLKIVVC